MREGEDGFADLPHGGRLHYEIAGDRASPAVTLLHPGLWDARTWDPHFGRWTERFRVLRYDQRGYGGSSRPDGSPYSHVRDLVALLDHLDIERTALVGCSMGGGLAIDATLTVPERVWALVPIAPGLGGFEDTEEEEAWWDELAPARSTRRSRRASSSARRTCCSRSGRRWASTTRPGPASARSRGTTSTS